MGVVLREAGWSALALGHVSPTRPLAQSPMCLLSVPIRLLMTRGHTYLLVIEVRCVPVCLCAHAVCKYDWGVVGDHQSLADPVPYLTSGWYQQPDIVLGRCNALAHDTRTSKRCVATHRANGTWARERGNARLICSSWDLEFTGHRDVLNVSFSGSYRNRVQATSGL